MNPQEEKQKYQPSHEKMFTSVIIRWNVEQCDIIFHHLDKKKLNMQYCRV